MGILHFYKYFMVLITFRIYLVHKILEKRQIVLKDLYERLCVMFWSKKKILGVEVN